MKKMIDITRTIGLDTINYYQDKKFSLIEDASFKKGDKWNSFRLEMSNHFGTHIDAPLHLFPKGKSLNDFSEFPFVLPCTVIEINNKKKITLEEIKNIRISKNSAVLFKTSNSKLERKIFSKKFIYIDPLAAEYLVKKKVKLVGIDYLSVDPLITDYPVHKILLSNEIIILEDAFLAHVSAGRYCLYCFPMKIKNANGAPVRAMLSKK